MATKSTNQTVLLVFLRHFGCVFCKEAMSDLSQIKNNLEEKGIYLVLVHMASSDIADSYIKRFNLEGVDHISDPDKDVYAQFGLSRGSVSQLFGLSTWMRGFALQANGFELEQRPELGDSFQMPGIFVVQDGEIVKEYIHRKAAERPDYMDIINCVI